MVTGNNDWNPVIESKQISEFRGPLNELSETSKEFGEKFNIKLKELEQLITGIYIARESNELKNKNFPIRLHSSTLDASVICVYKLNPQEQYNDGQDCKRL